MAKLYFGMMDKRWRSTRPIDDALTEFRREHVGFVFQSYNLIASLTAKENVELVTDIAEDPMPAARALELVDLADRADHFPSQLSGGEQQRVAIARAIAKQPTLLLCDEPTGALDYRTGVRVLDVLETINRETGTTTAVITHNAPVSKMAHRIIRLVDGQVSEITVNDYGVSRPRICAGDLPDPHAAARRITYARTADQHHAGRRLRDRCLCDDAFGISIARTFEE